MARVENAAMVHEDEDNAIAAVASAEAIFLLMLKIIACEYMI